jgi:hypothetical protein
MPRKPNTKRRAERAPKPCPEVKPLSAEASLKAKLQAIAVRAPNDGNLKDDTEYRMVDFLDATWRLSRETHGPDDRTSEVLASIATECDNMRLNGGISPIQWVDIVMLAMEGAMCFSATPRQLTRHFIKRLRINKATRDSTEHVRGKANGARTRKADKSKAGRSNSQSQATG